MSHLLKASLSAVVILAVAACADSGASEGEDAASGSATAAVAPLAAHTFGSEVRDQACEVLTPAMVAAAVSVPVDDLRQTEMWGRICIYNWSGGEARLTMVSVSDDAEVAATRFDQSYRVMSEEEAAEGAAAVRAALDQQVADGELEAEQAEQAGNLGGMLADIAATQQLEPVDGIGQRAVYDGTVRTMNMPIVGERVVAESQAAVLLGNVIYTVEARVQDPNATDDGRAGPSAEARARNRTVTLDLARAIGDRLLQMH